MKYCKDCDTEKVIEEFYNNKRSIDGKSQYCKLCMDKRRNKWKSENPDKVKKSQSRRGKKHYQNHLEEERERARQKNMRPENVQKRKQKYEGNREEILEQQQQYRLNNIEIVREKDRKKRKFQAQRGLVQLWSSKRKARKASLPNTLTLEQWQLALAYWNNRCAVCGREFVKNPDYICAMDHWIPLSSQECPGTVVTNMIPLCHGKAGCNNSKSTKLPQEWLLKKFGVEQAAQILSRVDLYFETMEKLNYG